MKMYLGDTPIKLMNIKHYELDTNDATMVASDLQSGVTCYAKGKKVIGTGKSFEFASYGDFPTNESAYVPTNINVIQIASMNEPVQHTIALTDMKNKDFSSPLKIGNAIVNGISYPIFAEVKNNLLSITCEQTITLEVFYGKDNYV